MTTLPFVLGRVIVASMMVARGRRVPRSEPRDVIPSDGRAGWRRPPPLRGFVAIGLVLVCVTVQAQAPSRDELLKRLAAYAARFVLDFSNVVAVERYEQQNTSPGRQPTRIRSDFLLVRAPGEESKWLQFRDVREVNRQPIGDAERRLEQLFLEPFDNARRRAEEIVASGSRYLSPLYMPLMALACVQTRDQAHYRFTGGSLEGLSRGRIRTFEFVEIAGGPIGAALGRMQVGGKVWFEETTGRVTRTELRIGALPARLDVATVFGHDGKLDIDVPVQMIIGGTSGRITGIMKYSEFRRFEVRTEESLRGIPSAK
jgi:hypothetical protein